MMFKITNISLPLNAGNTPDRADNNKDIKE